MSRRLSLTGMPLLIGLLVVTFAIAADLAHEAWRTAVAQQETAERAGRDFVRLTATSVAYEAQSTISQATRALFSALGRHGVPIVGVPGPDVLERASARARDCHCAAVVAPSYYFRVRVGDGEVKSAGVEPPSPAEQAWLRDAVARRALEGERAGWDATLLYEVVGGRPRIAAVTVRTDGREAYVYGLTSDVAPFAEAMFSRETRGAPRVDAAGTSHAVSYDSLAHTFVLAPNGSAIYDARPRPPELRVTMVPTAGHESYVPAAAPVTPSTLYADTVSLGPQFGDLRVDVALAAPEPALVSGRALPRSRYLALFGLLVLMGGLVVVAVRQLQREHELSRLRADLTAGVSHELRTPLAQILLFGETLMFERTRSERERRAAAEVIVREARRLMHLVENALHFTRVDRQLFEPSSDVIDLAMATREILVSFAPLAWAAKVTLREVIDEPTPALMNAAAYRQVLLNLLENAVRYGPVGQTITVRVAPRGEMARLTVDDEGPGIPAGDRERIWSPFVRLTRVGEGTLGTGIGLAVVRDLTRRYGGSAWVERSDMGGARFVVELPARAEGLGARVAGLS